MNRSKAYYQLLQLGVETLVQSFSLSSFFLLNFNAVNGVKYNMYRNGGHASPLSSRVAFAVTLECLTGLNIETLPLL